jgi:O-antigen/teichoic acid export membrane protein
MRKDWGGIPANIIFAKFLLIACLSPVFLIATLHYFSDATTSILFYICSLATCFSTLFSSALKSEGEFARDTFNSLTSNVLIVCFCGVAWRTGSATSAAFALSYLLGQIFYLFLSKASYRRIGRIAWATLSLQQVMSELRGNIVFALDVVVIRAYLFLDVLVLGVFASITQVGLYQAGQKVFSASLLPIQAVNNVALPFLSKHNRHEDRRLRLKLTAQIGALGVTSCAVCALLGPTAVQVLYGSEYQEVGDLMWMFGIVAALRYVAFSQALVLTAAGKQGHRLLANSVNLGVFAIFAIPLSQWFGVQGLLCSLIVAAATLCILYAFQVRNA